MTTAQTRISAENRPTGLSLKRTAGSQPAIRAGRKVHTSRMRHGAPVRRSGVPADSGSSRKPAARRSSSRKMPAAAEVTPCRDRDAGYPSPLSLKAGVVWDRPYTDRRAGCITSYDRINKRTIIVRSNRSPND